MSIHDPSDAPWTTARCKRLLRPISSRLTLLRKKNPSQVHNNDQYATSFTHNPNPPVETGALSIAKGSWSDASPSFDRKDPEWQPDVEESPRKRLRRTYSSKSSQTSSRQEARHATVQPILQLPSPLVGRSVTQRPNEGNPSGLRNSHLATQIESNATKVASFKKRGYPWVAKANPRDTFRRLVKAIAPSDWMIYDGIYSALHTLLQSTMGGRPSAHTTTLSLFSMCLRKLPKHIVKEQALAEEEDPDDPEDVVSFMYNELEGFSSGREPMREVVRAHGILLLCQAIEERLILPAIARKLAMACLEDNAPLEAELLIESMLKVMGSIPKPQSNLDRLFSQSNSPAFQAMNDMSHYTGHYRFLFSQLSRLFEYGTIDVAWASSQDMVDVWNRALRAIAQDQHASLEAMELIQTVVKRTYASRVVNNRNDFAGKNISQFRHVPDSHMNHFNSHGAKTDAALLATISNILTIVLSTAYADRMYKDPSPFCNTNAAINLQLLRRLNADSLSHLTVLPAAALTDKALPSKVAMVYIPILTMQICTQHVTNEPSSKYPALESPPTEPASLQKNVLDILASLLCSMAQCCSRITLSPPFDIMKHLMENLKRLNTDHHRQRIFNRIAVSTAFEFAEGTMRQEHLDWALRIEEVYVGVSEEPSPGRVPNTSRQQERKSTDIVSFRWEDSICEWVACTPALTKARAKKAMARHSAKPRLSDVTQESDGTGTTSSEEDTEPTSIDSSQEVSPLQAQRPLSKLEPLVVIPKNSRFSHPGGDQEQLPKVSPSVVISRTSRYSRSSQRSPSVDQPIHLRFRPRGRRKQADNSQGNYSSSSMSATEEKHGPKLKYKGARELMRSSNIEVRIPVRNSRDALLHPRTGDLERRLRLPDHVTRKFYSKTATHDTTDESADELGL